MLHLFKKIVILLSSMSKLFFYNYVRSKFLGTRVSIRMHYGQKTLWCAFFWRISVNPRVFLLILVLKLITIHHSPLSLKFCAGGAYLPDMYQNCFYLTKKTLGFQLHKIFLNVSRMLETF